MDLTFQTDGGIFNYRVCAVIIQNNMLLAMKNQRTPYYFLPGGRVQLHEAAEDAILRELKEELNIVPAAIRPLWFNQGFFTEDVTDKRFHELCLYYLVDISGTNLLSKGMHFEEMEGTNKNKFDWIPLSQLENTYLYPLFIKKEIFNLPEHLTILTEFES